MAFDADTVFEIRSDGNDDNGGGFYDRNPGTSVDYSQQTAAQLTLTDLAMVAFSTTLTSATGGFTAAMVGNLIHIKSGTNFTYSFFEIVGYTDTNTVTLDRTANSTGSPATGGTGSIGGALGSVGQLGEVWSTLATAGMRGYIKTGNYTVNVDSANVSGGKLNLTSGSIALRLEAYKTARGDMGVDEYAVMILSAGITGRMIDLGDSGHTLCAGILVDAATNDSYLDAAFTNAASNGGNHYVRCGAIGNGNGNAYVGFDDLYTARYCWVVGFDYGFRYGRCSFYMCYAKCVDYGFYRSDAKHDRCIADSCYIGFYNLNGNYDYDHCIAYGCGSDGFNLYSGRLNHCVSYGNGGYGFGYNSAAWFMTGNILYQCAAGSNSSGTKNSNIPDSIVFDMKTLTVDPFVDGGGGDFRPNDTAGGGAELRAMVDAIYGQSQKEDIGAVQHAEAAGGGGGARTIIVGGLRGGLS